MNKFRGFCMVVSIVVLLLGIASWAQPSAHANTNPECYQISGNKICIFNGPTGHDGSIRIATGLDKDLWFGSLSLNQLIRFTTKGAMKAFTVPDSGSGPAGIVEGPDKRMWFTEFSIGDVGAMTGSGSFSEYPLTFSPSDALQIVIGADKNLWAPTDNNGILKITTKGDITEYDLPDGGNASQPTAVTLGSDKNIWFLEANGPCFQGEDYTNIGKVTTDGNFTIYPVDVHGNGFGIATGPDKRIWFADPGGCDGYTSRIGAIKTNGTGLKYYTKNLPPLVDTIINGGDGNLYFATFTNQIGRISTTGKVKVWTLPSTYNIAILGMCVGPDGNIWFAANNGPYIGVLHIK